MNKVRLLSILSVGLLVVNVFLIWFLISHNPEHHRGGEPKYIIIKKLDLDKAQTKEYEKLIEWHKREIRNSEQQIMMLKNQLYSSLRDVNKVTLSDSLVTEIGRMQMNVEKIHYKHFQDIKQLCKPEQLKAFNELCLGIAELFVHPPPNKQMNDKQ